MEKINKKQKKLRKIKFKTFFFSRKNNLLQLLISLLVIDEKQKIKFKFNKKLMKFWKKLEK